MKPNETISGIKIINTLNTDINRKGNNIIGQIPPLNIFKRDKIRLKRISNHAPKSSGKSSLNISKKKFMTKEQRYILKSFLKENAKKNRKAVAKNLIGFFMESSKNGDRFKLKNKLKKESKKQLPMESMKEITHTPRPVFHAHDDSNNAKVNKKGIKKRSTNEIRPSGFNKEFKSKFNNNLNINSNKKVPEKKSDRNVNIKMINNSDDEEHYSNIVEFHKNMNFTNLFKLQQNINEINKTNTTTRFSTPKRIMENHIQTNFELENKKNMIFQIKSFRDFVDNNSQKNYDECLRFINNTTILSHLDDPEKTLIIQSLKIESFPKSQYVQKANEKFTTMYFVKEGLLQCVDDKGTCIKTLTTGQCFGEKEILIDIKSNYNIITISDCICYAINVKSFKKMFGHKYSKFIFYNFIKAAFDCSKLFQSINIFYAKKIFKFLNIVNLNKDNVAFPIGHKKSSKMIIIISGILVNSKTGKKEGGPLDILFEEELISLNDEKIKYALNPSSETLFFEGDTLEILQYLKCNNFNDVFNKNIIFKNLSQITLFKAFSSLKLYKLIDLIHIEQYKNGEKIIKEKTKGDKFYIVKTGQVEVFQRNIYLRTLNAMEYFGERALLTNEVRSASVIAKGNVELYCLDKDNFNSNLSDLMLNYLNISLYLHDETVSLEDLLFIKEIGRGNYGSVSLVMNKKTKFPYAIKAICKKLIIQEDLAENILLEKNIILKIDHPFIVKLVKSIKDENNVYFLLEYVKGKELFEVLRDIGYLNKEQTNFYIASLMTAINYLHERKIIYRDIKPENIIVVKNGYLKLIDFGTAKEIEDRTKTIIGTPHYMAPEVILGREYSFPVDYWSISICMYEFICGEVPFGEREEDPMEIYFAIINDELYFNEKFIKIDKEFKHIMKKMLDKNPSYRLCNFYSIKNQAWFKDFNWDELSNLNLKAPYIPVIPEFEFDFDEQCKPKFDVDKNKFREYVDYITESNKQYENIENNISEEKLNEYKKWYDKF